MRGGVVLWLGQWEVVGEGPTRPVHRHTRTYTSNQNIQVGFPTLMRTALFGVGGTDLGGSDDDNDDDAASSRAALERCVWWRSIAFTIVVIRRSPTDPSMSHTMYTQVTAAGGRARAAAVSVLSDVGGQGARGAAQGPCSNGMLAVHAPPHQNISKLQSHLTHKQVQFGAEFRYARAAAERVGAQVVLGDRPIELTLKRAWAAMGPEERGAVLLAGAALVFGLRQRREEGGNHAAGGGGIEGLLASLKAEAGSAAASARGDSSSEPQQPQPQPEELAPVPASGLELGGYRGADDALLQSLERFGQAFPSLYEALIGERDRYLAWACKRSRAVNGAPRVVAVMGALHLPGVVATMREDNGGDTLNFKDVAKLPPIYGPLAAETNTWGNGGVALSPGTRRLLGRAAGRWAVTGLPRLARDVAVGTVAVEGLKLGYAQAAPQLEGWWTEVVGGLPPLPFLLS